MGTLIYTTGRRWPITHIRAQEVAPNPSPTRLQLQAPGLLGQLLLELKTAQDLARTAWCGAAFEGPLPEGRELLVEYWTSPTSPFGRGWHAMATELETSEYGQQMVAYQVQVTAPTWGVAVADVLTALEAHLRRCPDPDQPIPYQLAPACEREAV